MSISRIQIRKLSFLAVAMLGLFGSAAAQANRELRVVQSRSGASESNSLSITVQPGDPLELEAHIYEDGRELRDEDQVDSRFSWSVDCGRQHTPCNAVELPPDTAGDTLTTKVSDEDFRSARILVTYHDPSGDLTGIIELKKAADDEGKKDGEAKRDDKKKPHGREREKAREEDPSSAAPAERGGRSRGRDYRGSPRNNDGDSSPAGHRGGYRGNRGGNHGANADSVVSGGIVSAAGSDGKTSKARSRGKKLGDEDFAGGAYHDNYFGGGEWFGGMGGLGGSSSSSATTMRGYNRDNEVPVIFCSHEMGRNGRLEMRCEDPAKKTLRVAKPKVEPKAKKTTHQVATANKKTQLGLIKVAAKGVKLTAKAKPLATRNAAKPKAPTKSVVASRK